MEYLAFVYKQTWRVTDKSFVCNSAWKASKLKIKTRSSIYSLFIFQTRKLYLFINNYLKITFLKENNTLDEILIEEWNSVGAKTKHNRVVAPSKFECLHDSQLVWSSSSCLDTGNILTMITIGQLTAIDFFFFRTVLV